MKLCIYKLTLIVWQYAGFGTARAFCQIHKTLVEKSKLKHYNILRVIQRGKITLCKKKYIVG